MMSLSTFHSVSACRTVLNFQRYTFLPIAVFDRIISQIRCLKPRACHTSNVRNALQRDTFAVGINLLTAASLSGRQCDHACRISSIRHHPRIEATQSGVPSEINAVLK